MIKEDATVLNQLLLAMKDSVRKMEEYYNKKDKINLERAKKEILMINRKMEGFLK